MGSMHGVMSDFDELQHELGCLRSDHFPDASPLPDLEAELRAAIARAFERRDERDNYTRIDLLLAEEIRPLLQRAAGGRAEPHIVDRIEKHAENAIQHLKSGDLYGAEKSMAGVMIDCRTLRRRSGRANDGTRGDVHDLRIAALGMPLDG